MMGGKNVERLLRLLTWTAGLLTLGILLFIVAFIVWKGVPYLQPSLFSWTYTSQNVSLLPALIATVEMTVLALVIAAPLGVLTAIYLVEYAQQGRWAVDMIRLTTETLAGVPSIVYGLFGMLFFVTYLTFGFSLLAGACTLAIMILPVVIRATEEALLAVPLSYREGAYGLGAGKCRTIWSIVVPAAKDGIIAGLMLSVGRIVGETAALIYTAGTVAQIPSSAYDSARTLSVHMYQLSSEGLHMNEGYATATVLLLVVMVINLACSTLKGASKR